MEHYREGTIRKKPLQSLEIFFIHLQTSILLVTPAKIIEELLHEQVRPWDSGHGIMMGYGSTFDIDMHFWEKQLN
jgi:hypothetical protein